MFKVLPFQKFPSTLSSSRVNPLNLAYHQYLFEKGPPVWIIKVCAYSTHRPLAVRVAKQTTYLRTQILISY